MEAGIKASRREYATLDAMRGVAAIAVVFFHGASLLGSFAPSGYLAVDFFFTLSGFVIAHAYEHRLRAGLGRREFTLVRLIRFYPLYIAGFAIGAVNELLLVATHNAFALPPGMLAMAILAGALFLPAPLAVRDYDLFPINVPCWSLFFELLVNILYAVVLPWLSVAALVIAILFSAVALLGSMPPEGLAHVGVTAQTFLPGCARTILSFSLGLLIHRLRLRAPAVPVALLLLATAASFMVVASSVVYDLTFVLLLSPLLVVLGASVEPPAVLARNARFLGLVSFPVYALHRPVLSIAQAIAHRLPVPPAVIGWPGLVLLLVICGSIALRYDTASRALLSRWRRRRLPADQAQSAAP